MTEILVRPRHDADLAACAASLVAVHAVDGYSVEGVADPVAWLRPPGLRMAWVAVLGGKVVGHIGLATPGVSDAAAGIWSTQRPSDKVAVLCRLFVDPTARGHALGMSLLQAAIEEARAQDTRLVGDVMAKDEVAIHLYEKLGWQRIADITHPDGHGNDISAYCYASP
jgi:GNAT superfamily N-acetyltransferase